MFWRQTKAHKDPRGKAAIYEPPILANNILTSSNAFLFDFLLSADGQQVILVVHPPICLGSEANYIKGVMYFFFISINTLKETIGADELNGCKNPEDHRETALSYANHLLFQQAGAGSTQKNIYSTRLQQVSISRQRLQNNDF